MRDWRPLMTVNDRDGTATGALYDYCNAMHGTRSVADHKQWVRGHGATENAGPAWKMTDQIVNARAVATGGISVYIPYQNQAR